MDKVKGTNQLEQLMPLSPAKVTTVTSIPKKIYEISFTKNTFQIHPTVIPFLTVMIDSKFTATKKLQPFVAPINHNPKFV
jgi:hypothetical protein